MILNSFHPLLALAIILLAGLVAGSLVRKIHLPSVTGQILIGIMIGHSGFALFDPSLIQGLRPITHFALGLITVMVGSHLHFRRLRNAGRRLLVLMLLEVILIPLFVFMGTRWFTFSHWTLALLMATISISTAPATIIAIVRETRSKGVFVKTLIAAVALNNIICICSFEIARGMAHLALGDVPVVSSLDVLIRPIKELGAAGLLGVLCGIIFRFGTPFVVRWNQLSVASFIMILFTWGLASSLNLSPLLACLFLGITLINLDPENEYFTDAPFAQFESAILAAFFTLAGIELDLSDLGRGGVVALVVFFARFLGKYISAYGAMSLAHATDRVRRFFGFGPSSSGGNCGGLSSFGGRRSYA